MCAEPFFEDATGTTTPILRKNIYVKRLVIFKKSSIKLHTWE